jgi:hypothetical protein
MYLGAVFLQEYVYVYQLKAHGIGKLFVQKTQSNLKDFSNVLRL